MQLQEWQQLAARRVLWWRERRCRCSRCLPTSLALGKRLLLRLMRRRVCSALSSLVGSCTLGGRSWCAWFAEYRPSGLCILLVDRGNTRPCVTCLWAPAPLSWGYLCLSAVMHVAAWRFCRSSRHSTPQSSEQPWSVLRGCRIWLCVCLSSHAHTAYPIHHLPTSLVTCTTTPRYQQFI